MKSNPYTYIRRKIHVHIRKRLINYFKKLIRKWIYDIVMEMMLFEVRYFVDSSKVKIGANSSLSNALLNTNSGTITIGEYTFFGQNVSIITGTHDYNLFGVNRMKSIPQSGQDIVIGNGVWIGSNATIIGPCIIGDNAVIGAGSVVVKDVAPYEIVAGVPAKSIKIIEQPNI